MRRERIVTFLLWMASVLTLRVAVAEGAEALPSSPSQPSVVRAISAHLELRDEIHLDMGSGTVTRVPTGAPLLGAGAVSNAELDTVYSNFMEPALIAGWTQSPPSILGDIVRTERAGVLDHFKFYATHNSGFGTLQSARYRIRFYDASDWPTRPSGYPTQLLFTMETPTLTLNLPGDISTPVVVNNFPFPTTLPRDLLVTFERFAEVPTMPIVSTLHSPPGSSPSIGESPGSWGCGGNFPSCGEGTFAGLGHLCLDIVLRCAPASDLAPTTLNVTVPLGGSGASSFSLANVSSCPTLTYSVTSPSLMSATPTSGIVPAFSVQGVDVTVTPGIVPLGFSGSGDVVVTTDDPANPSRTVRVNYTVKGSLRRATSGVCYATQGSSAVGTPRLYRVDLATGAATAVGSTSGVLVPAMAIEPREGRMFAAMSSLLTRVDVGSGALASVANTPCASAMTFSPSGQLLKMGCDSTLYVVDASTGAQVSAGQVSPHMSGIAFDPTTGLLYGVRKGPGPGTDQLYRIAYPGGATTLVGSLGSGLPIGDITFDESGNLFGVVGEDAAPNQLVSISKTTGQAMVIGPTGANGLSTLSYFAPTVNCRFAGSVEGFSSQYGPTDFSAHKALGPPDTYPDYGGTQFWIPALPDAPSEFLHLGFSNPAPIDFVTVYETFAPGAIRTIRVKNPDTGLFETVWSGTPAAAPPVSRVFTATFPVTPFPVSEVYLDIASDLVADHNAIDAVGIGYRDLRAASQWAASVAGFSSQFSPTAWSAQQALGPPDLFPLYADAGTAWASATPDGQREHLELDYSSPAPINFVNVVETYAPGALDRVSVWNPNTLQFEQVWSGTAAAAPPVARINAVSFPLTRFPVSRVRLEFDSPAVPGWNEIDAVGIGSCECEANPLDTPSPSEVPLTSSLGLARPNPFGASTSISLSLARAGRLEVEVFDLHGKRVARLVDGMRAAGQHEIHWDGRDSGGRAVENGIYYLRMTADGQSDSRKIIKLD